MLLDAVLIILLVLSVVIFVFVVMLRPGRNFQYKNS